METIGYYKYYSNYRHIICMEHFCAIITKSIDHYIHCNLRKLTRTLKKEKKDAYFATIVQIRDTLLSFAIMAKNISSVQLIPFFLSLSTFFSANHCIYTTNCHFAICFQRTVHRHIKKIYLEKKWLYK